MLYQYNLYIIIYYMSIYIYVNIYMYTYIFQFSQHVVLTVNLDRQVTFCGSWNLVGFCRFCRCLGEIVAYGLDVRTFAQIN